MAGVSQLGYLGLGVSNVTEWERFATEVLGAQVSERSADGTLFLRMDERFYRIAIHPTGKDDVEYLGWEAKDEETLHEIADRVRACGVQVFEGKPEDAASRRVAGLIRFSDPNGVANEVYYGPLVRFDIPFHSPRPISGFVTGQQGIGHVFLRVVDLVDLEESIRFYRDALGMKISDYVQLVSGDPRRRAVFFHCNPRHHSLAIAALPQPSRRLGHFMLQVMTIDDVGITYYLAQDRGVPIAATLGRHTNDHMVSFYMTTPSGFEVEYGYGAREVDDAIWQVTMHEAASSWGHRRQQVAPPATPSQVTTAR